MFYFLLKQQALNLTQVLKKIDQSDISNGYLEITNTEGGRTR